MAKHHPHRHVHPHRKGSHHHHPHRTPHPRQPSELAHHHPITKLGGRPAPPSTATSRVKAVWRFVYTWFPHAATLGIYNCRKIAGSSSWSEHAWADAWDITDHDTSASGKPSNYMDAIVAAIRHRQGELHVTRVLWRDGGVHDRHAHVDLDPDHGGSPPCA